MIGRTNAGGAGGGLNFVVKAYTTEEALLAAAPKENTIGVVTNTAVPKWGFSALESSAPEEGEIWFSLGTESDAAFNALKKNILSVYPVNCCQYISESWSNKNAHIFKNGSWTQFSYEWSGELYDIGNQYEAITGGWITKGITLNTTNSTYQDGLPTVDDNGLSVNNAYKILTTLNKVSFDGYSNLHIIGKLTNINETHFVKAGVWSEWGSTSTDNLVVYKNLGTGTNKVFEAILDVSSLNDSYYPGIALYRSGCTISQAYLEK